MDPEITLHTFMVTNTLIQVICLCFISSIESKMYPESLGHPVLSYVKNEHIDKKHSFSD
jgi:hypothetical protein